MFANYTQIARNSGKFPKVKKKNHAVFNKLSQKFPHFSQISINFQKIPQILINFSKYPGIILGFDTFPEMPKNSLLKIATNSHKLK